MNAKEELRSYEWVVIVLILAVLLISTKIALNAPDQRWPTKEGNPVPAPQEQLVISITGAVLNEGRYHFEKGTTLRQALQQVKLTPDADISRLFLDKELKRGQKVRIPKKKITKARKTSSKVEK